MSPVDVGLMLRIRAAVPDGATLEPTGHQRAEAKVTDSQNGERAGSRSRLRQCYVEGQEPDTMAAKNLVEKLLLSLA